MKKISVVIVSRDGSREGNVPLLLEDLKNQSMPSEPILITGVSPVGKARNQGLQKAMGDIIVFLDDDVRLPENNFIRKITEAVERYPGSLVGGGHLIPPVSGKLERWIARELPRQEIAPAIIDKDSDRIGTCCWASEKLLYTKLGGFREDITAGEDTEFRKRVRASGRRTIMISGLYVYHPAKGNLPELFKQYFWYGKGIGSTIKADRVPHIIFKLLMPIYIMFRFSIAPAQLFFPNFHRLKDNCLSQIKMNPLQTIMLLIYYLGFACG